MTAVIVSHDGHAWLPHMISALREQSRPVHRVVAVDTGSRDRSGSLLAAELGQGAVFGMERSTGFAAAVRRAMQHKAASAPVPGRGEPSRGRAEQAEWIWLLHDDCEPAPDALEQLLRGATETPAAAVLGPKLMDWNDRRVILEAGVTMDTAGRRITGVEPREVDQGQHDGDRDCLAVSSAGMLVRRDVWDLVGGFDPGMTLFCEDIDFCWRVHAAGYRVRVITDAVVYHVQAATRNRRHISVGRRAMLLQRRNGLVTLLGNLPAGLMFGALLGNVVLSLLRTLFYLVAKRPAAALDESAAVASVVGKPLSLAQARRRRARGRRAAYSRLRGDIPAGRSIRRMAEFAASVLSPSQLDTVGAHHASDDPTDDDSLLTDTGFVQRLLTRPAVLLVLGLLVVAGVAERSVIGGGTLGGGFLLPAWEGASGLWSEFLQAFHPTGVGSTSFGPPYLAVVALLATVLLGKSWLAIDVLLLGCVPLAGLTATMALRRVTTSVPVRVWAAASYALLPVAFGVIATGRLGTAVAFVLIPLIGLLSGRMFTQPRQLARRAAWATGLVVAVGAAFVPLLWPMAVVGAVLAVLTLGRSRPGVLLNLVIAVVTPLVLLMPWLFQLLSHPSQLLLEAGVQQPGLAASRLSARSLLLLSPGGPGLPPYWVSAGLLLAGLVALLAVRRRTLVKSGWCVALLGFVVALGVSRVTVTPPGGQAMTAWPGTALSVAAAGLLLAVAAAGDGLGALALRGARQAGPARVAGRAGLGRGRPGLLRRLDVRSVGIGALVLAAVSAPLLAAAFWLVDGVNGPVRPASGPVVPSLVSVTAGAGHEVRTLVLTFAGGHVSFLLLRGNSPEFGDPGLTPVAGAQTALANAVAALVAPDGGQAVDQAGLLADFDIGFVLIRAPVDRGLAATLDAVPGLTQDSMNASFDLWRLTSLPAEASVVEPSGAVVAVPVRRAEGPGATAPVSGGTLELAEPSGGWHASLDGHALTPVRSPAGRWAQAFKLPPGGGRLTIGRNGLGHETLTTIELLLFLVVAALALPGVRTAAEIQAATAQVELAGSGDREGVAADAGVADEAGVAAGSGVAAAAGQAAGPSRAEDSVQLADSVAPRPAGTGGRRGSRSRLGRPIAAKRRLGRGLGPRVWAARRADGGTAPEPPLTTGVEGRTSGRAGRRPAAGLAASSGVMAQQSGPRETPEARAAAARGAPAAAARSASAREAAPRLPSGVGGTRAAWPAGQPSSRFISGPPAAAATPPAVRSYSEREESDRRDRERADYDGREVERRDYDRQDRDRQDRDRAEYDRQDRERGDYDRQDRERGEYDRQDRERGEYDRQDRDRAEYAWSEYDQSSPAGRPYRGRSPSGALYPDAAAEDQSQHPRAGSDQRPGGGSGWPGSWESDDRPSSWPAVDGRQDWPQDTGPEWHDDSARGPHDASSDRWQQAHEDAERGWQRDYPASSRPSRQQWPGEGDELEALPEIELHHGWAGSDDRSARSWPAPEQETDGEAW